MNTSDFNPNIETNKCTKETEFRIISENRHFVAQKKDGPDGIWVDLVYYRKNKKDYRRAEFVKMKKAKRFIKKLAINAQEK
jgi:sarcosine oxidase delta subunit